MTTRSDSQTSKVAAIDDSRIERFESFRRRHFATLRPVNVVEESLVEIMAIENWRRLDSRLAQKDRDRASRSFDRALKSLTRMRLLAGRGPVPPLPTVRQRIAKPQSDVDATSNVIEMPMPSGSRDSSQTQPGSIDLPLAA
jgi:hypothetical protein